MQFLLRVSPQTAAMASWKDKLALHFAAGEGHLDVVQELLRVYPQGAYLPSAKGKLPLHFCSRWGHQDVAMELLRYYPDAVRALDWEGSLPLHEACREGQAAMARFLMDLLPEALATANLRNELPLFPAVRVNSLELVIDLLQAWPAGAKHVLQNVTEDDRIATWDPAIVEALLRATVESWDDFVPWQSRPPAIFRLQAEVNYVLPVVSEEGDEEGKGARGKEKSEKSGKKKNKVKKDKKNKDKKNKQEELGTIEHRQPRLWTAGPFTSIRVERITHFKSLSRPARSKSPLLKIRDEPFRPSKRIRRSYRKQRSLDGETDDDFDAFSVLTTEDGRVFLPLQAALVAKASLPVLKFVQELFPDTARDVTDHEKKSLLHLALEHGELARDVEENGGTDWIFEHVYHPSLAAERESCKNALPLHLALANRASCRIVKALLVANPSSAVDSCQTRDEFSHEKPLTLACQSGCDHSTIYLLLRADPSVVTGMCNAFCA